LFLALCNYHNLLDLRCQFKSPTEQAESKAMATAALHKRMDADRNPETWEEAESLLRSVEARCMPIDPDAMAEGFDENCVCKFGLYPEMRGREAVREFYRQRSKRQKNYKVSKNLRAMTNDTLAIVFTASWEDAKSGAKMYGEGAEIWKLRNGKIEIWNCSFNVAEAGKKDDLGIL
jgi:nuclear transport factor 2 (NTF2) superfamily protein